MAIRHCVAAVALLAACQPTIGDAPGIGRGEARPDAGFDPPRPDAAPDPGVPTPDGGRTERTLSQNMSDEIEDLHSIACINRDDDGNPIETRENSYYRVFVLEEERVEGDFEVSAVRFGIESATSPDEDAQPATVRLHTLEGEFLTESLTELAAVTVDVEPQEGTYLEVPIRATVAAGSTLVAELFIENSTSGRLFFIGSNSQGQTAPSYIRAPSSGCVIPEPTDLAEVAQGFPDVHIILSVKGTEL
jgi:hypothetical protein